MIKKLARSIREYKKPTIITILFMTFEAIIETIIPFITANLVNQIKEGLDVDKIVWTGVLLIVMAIVSLLCAAIAGVNAAKASTGFGKNLRKDMFDQIQKFSFENIDKLISDCNEIKALLISSINTAKKSN